MENINKEKKSFFKSKMFIISMVALMLLSLVSAAVYVYVSNTSTVTVTVGKSMQTFLNDDTGLTTLPLSVLANNDIVFTINERNNGANAAIVYPVLLQITSPSGIKFSGNEIAVLTNNGVGVPLSYLKYIKADGTYDVFANIGAANTETATLMVSATAGGATLDTFSFAGGQQDDSDVVITTALGMAEGTYTIKACTINNLVGATCA
jgi:hypothetical protein